MNNFKLKRNLLTGSLLFVMGFWIQLENNWWTLRISGMRGFSNYIDLNAVLVWAACFKKIGNDVYLGDDSTCSGYLYGSTLLRLVNFLRISESYTNHIGIILIILLSITFGFFLVRKENSILIRFALIATLYSPGIWLLLERGNIDSVIFLLVFGSCLAYIKNRRLIFILGISVSAIFKFYTLPLLFLSAFIVKNIKYKIVSIISFIVCTTIIILDIARIDSDFPKTWYASFGNPVLGKWLNLFIERFNFSFNSIGMIATNFLGFLLFLLVTRLLWKFKKITIKFQSKNNSSRYFSLEEIFMVCFGTVFLSCYFAGMNYDYRLVFLSGFLAAYLVYDYPFVLVNLPLIIFIVIAQWFSWFSFGYRIKIGQQPPDWFYIMQFVGDMSLLLLSSIIAIQIIHIFFKDVASQSSMR